MRLGYHTNSLQNHRLGDALELLARFGYRAVAITPDICHLDPTVTTDRDLDEVARRLRELDLVPVMETGARFLLDPAQKHEPTLMVRDRRLRQRRLDFLSRVAAMGARLGAQVVSFWSGIDRSPGPDTQDHAIDGIRAAAACIRAEGLAASLEPEPGMVVETVADWHRVRAVLGPEAPAMTLDIGHLYAVWEGDPVAVVAASVPYLAQVHLEDMRRGEHEHRLPGTGDVAFQELLTTLLQNGYGGPVCFELSRSSHLGPVALATCAQLWQQVLGGARH